MCHVYASESMLNHFIDDSYTTIANYIHLGCNRLRFLSVMKLVHIYLAISSLHLETGLSIVSLIIKLNTIIDVEFTALWRRCYTSIYF